MRKKLLTILFSLICLTVLAQKGLPNRPDPPRLVNDFTGMLTPDQQQAMESKLVAFDDSTSIQIAVVLIESLEGRDIAEYAVELGRAWGIGNKENTVVVFQKRPKDSHRNRLWRRRFPARHYGQPYH